MSVITVSRGTFTGGKWLAECVAGQLGYRCVDRDVIVERAGRKVSMPPDSSVLISPVEGFHP